MVFYFSFFIICSKVSFQVSIGRSSIACAVSISLSLKSIFFNMLHTKPSKFWMLFSEIWHRKSKYKLKNHWLKKIFTVFTVCTHVLYCDLKIQIISIWNKNQWFNSVVRALLGHRDDERILYKMREEKYLKVMKNVEDLMNLEPLEVYLSWFSHVCS